MQFYLNGYKPGDPLIADAHPSVESRTGELPDAVDVLIVGCGPAGLVLAAHLANFPEIRTVVIDRRDGPLAVGQADGVACRTVETFQTFGLATRLVDEAYWVSEVCFWQPDPEDRSRITRTGRVIDTEPGLSEFPHVIVNQARMLAYLLDYMERSSSKLRPHYGLHASALSIDANTGEDHPVTVTVEHLVEGVPSGETSRIKAKYVVGCDGSRSAIRTAIGRELKGDTKNVSWGVMDVLSATDFPDIRRKCTIQSAEHGAIVLIPREGGYLDRIYVELHGEAHQERLARGEVTLETIVEAANQILNPYTLEVRDVGWWSVYEIGQRLCDKFDDVPADQSATRLPRVFIAGDACHTHSAKAGQGMNVSIADAFNLGWKLAAVLKGTAHPELLHTYSQERQAVAQELIAFDEEWTKILSARPRSPEEPEGEGDGVDPAEFRDYFREHGHYTAGVSTHYGASLITAEPEFQALARGFIVGRRFHSAPVIRVADVRPMQLGHVAAADGAWRLYVFADARHPDAEDSRARGLLERLSSDESLIARFTPAGADPDSVIDVRAIFQQRHDEFELPSLPGVLLPRKGRFGLIDYEKVFCPDPGGEDIFDLRSIDRAEEAMVLVRPDQFVAHVLPLHRAEDLGEFLEAVLIDVRDAAPEPDRDRDRQRISVASS